MNIHPKADMLLLQAMQEAETTTSGLWIPEAARKQMNQGIILEMGPDILETAFKKGEIVIFPLHSEYKIDADGTTYILVRASEIIAGDGGEQAGSPEGVENIKLNRNKKKELPPSHQEKRRPIGLENQPLERVERDPNNEQY